MRSRILGSVLIAALLPGAAGATGGPVDGAPAAPGVYLVQRAAPASAPFLLLIVNDHDAVVVAAQGAAAEAVVSGVRGITDKPVSVVVASDGAVYRREFPDALIAPPREELTLFRGDRTIHLMSQGVWLPEEGIVVNRDLVPALSP